MEPKGEQKGDIERGSEIYINGNYTNRRRGSRGLQLKKLIKC